MHAAEDTGSSLYLPGPGHVRRGRVDNGGQEGRRKHQGAQWGVRGGGEALTHLVIHENRDNAKEGPHRHGREDFRPFFRGPWGDADAACFYGDDREETPMGRGASATFIQANPPRIWDRLAGTEWVELPIWSKEKPLLSQGLFPETKLDLDPGPLHRGVGVGPGRGLRPRCCGSVAPWVLPLLLHGPAGPALASVEEVEPTYSHRKMKNRF